MPARRAGRPARTPLRSRTPDAGTAFRSPTRSRCSPDRASPADGLSCDRPRGDGPPSSTTARRRRVSAATPTSRFSCARRPHRRAVLLRPTPEGCIAEHGEQSARVIGDERYEVETRDTDAHRIVGRQVGKHGRDATPPAACRISAARRRRRNRRGNSRLLRSRVHRVLRRAKRRSAASTLVARVGRKGSHDGRQGR